MTRGGTSPIIAPDDARPATRSPGLERRAAPRPAPRARQAATRPENVRRHRGELRPEQPVAQFVDGPSVAAEGGEVGVAEAERCRRGCGVRDWRPDAAVRAFNLEKPITSSKTRLRAGHWDRLHV